MIIFLCAFQCKGSIPVQHCFCGDLLASCNQDCCFQPRCTEHVDLMSACRLAATIQEDTRAPWMPPQHHKKPTEDTAGPWAPKQTSVPAR